MAESAFVAFVPEAEPLVRSLRARHDPSARAGAPAHITALFPFMEPALITAGMLDACSSVIAAQGAFSFELRSVGRFPATAYLVPQPGEGFIALTESLWRAFPAYPPFRGEFASVVPHLTVAHGNAAEAEAVAAELAASLQSFGPVRCACKSVALIENSSGRWKAMHVFSLASAPGT